MTPPPAASSIGIAPVSDKACWILLHERFCLDLFMELTGREPLRSRWRGSRIDGRLLRHTTYSAWAGLSQLESSRGIQADLHKVAAHLAAWLVRIRPIQMPEAAAFRADQRKGRWPDPERSPDGVDVCLPLLANSLLGAMVSFRIIGIDRDVGFWRQMKGYVRSMVYHFNFCGIPDPKGLGQELFLLERCWKYFNQMAKG